MTTRKTTGSSLELDVDTSGGSGGTLVDQGAAGSDPWPVEFLTPQAVTGPLTDTQLRATAVPISAASLPLPSGASTEATLALIKAKTDNIDVALSTRTKPEDQQHVIVDSGSITTGGLTDTQLRASPVSISAASLPLPTGAATLAEQQTQTASLSVMDDWDESDRAKVNLISGQAGIAGGTGTDASNVPRVSLATNIPLPAGTALLGRVSASDETNTIYDGTTALIPKFAKINTSSSGASQVVAAVTSKKIRVTDVILVANAAVNVKFQSHVTPTDLTGLLYLAANTGFAPGYDPTGHFETIAGEALDINLSGAQAVGGWLKYIEV